MTGDFALLQGEVIQILVGQMGLNGGSSEPGGGGGGTYVVRPPYTTSTSILVIAGGGSGAGNYASSDAVATTTGVTAVSGGAGGVNGNGGAGGSRGAGGGGFFTDGGPCTVNTAYSSPGSAFMNGGAGGPQTNHSCGYTTHGGFGGGASHGGNCIPNGGAGGGYSGGGGSYNNASAGGASYNSGTNQTNIGGNNTGHGRVVITELCSVRAFASGATNSVSPVMCAGSSVTLTTDAVSNYSWSTGQTTNSIVIAPTSNTVIQITGTSSLNCTATGVISITVSSGPPVLSISNPSNNICLGKAVSLTASGALSYTWTNPGVVNGQPFSPNATAVYTVSGQNGCGITTATTNITVAPLNVSTMASPVVVCQGNPATLTAVSSVSGYTWEPGTLIGNTVIVGSMANTIYTVTASDGTCVGTQTVAVSADPVPVVNVPSAFYSICEGGTITLTASGADTYAWMPGSQTGSAITVNPNQSTLLW